MATSIRELNQKNRAFYEKDEPETDPAKKRKRLTGDRKRPTISAAPPLRTDWRGHNPPRKRSRA
jgi:hypothetical protein